MKWLVVTAMLIGLVSFLKAQDTIRRYEFGSTLLTVNSFDKSYWYIPDRPAMEYMNGLFFRYSTNRTALRVHASYVEYALGYSSPQGTADGIAGDINGKDFRFGAGVQRSLLKRAEWLYAFLDVSYRNSFTTGHHAGGLAGVNDRVSNSANGYDLFLGLGFKIKAVRNVYLSPEMGLLSATKFVNRVTVPVNGGPAANSSYNETNVNSPVLKLHVTVKF